MNKETVLYRQVNPDWVKGDGVTSQVFRPSPKDENKVSTYNGEKFSPEEAYNHYVRNYKSDGVLGIKICECEDEELSCDEDNHQFDGHVSIDYSGFSRGEIERKAKKLRDKAWGRSWRFRKTPERPNDLN